MEVDTLKTDVIVGPSTSNMNSVNLTESLKLGLCEVCMVNNAKYTCPRCEVKTCCLKCSTIHKKELECDGARNRISFIPINKFSNMDLSSDFRLLEEITRTMETYRKDRRNCIRDNVPHHLIKLKKSSDSRKTFLKFLPANFERHRKNTTRLNYDKDVIFWHLDWIFTNAENLKLTDELIRETEKLGNILQKHLVKQEDKVLQEKLQYYQAAGLSGLRIFLKAEQKKGTKYYELDPLVDLKENLRGKMIIEYPTIHVLLKGHACCFDIIDSDDEDSSPTENKIGSQVIDNIIKKSEDDDNMHLSLKNLLFISENDGDMSE